MFTNERFNESHIMAGQRRKLVDELRRKGISSAAVLEAIGSVPRQLFFPRDFQQFIYRDAAFPIGHGQTISQPYTVAYQTELLHLKKGERVLEIGTGSGYQAAVLAAMGVQVYTVELIPALVQEAAALLKNIDSSIAVFKGDGSLGLPSEAPFDAILVTAGAPEVPAGLVQQLRDGGRMVIPVGDSKNDQKMLRVTRISASQNKTEVFGDFKFVPLIGKDAWDKS